MSGSGHIVIESEDEVTKSMSGSQENFGVVACSDEVDCVSSASNILDQENVPDEVAGVASGSGEVSVEIEMEFLEEFEKFRSELSGDRSASKSFVRPSFNGAWCHDASKSQGLRQGFRREEGQIQSRALRDGWWLDGAQWRRSSDTGRRSMRSGSCSDVEVPIESLLVLEEMPEMCFATRVPQQQNGNWPLPSRWSRSGPGATTSVLGSKPAVRRLELQGLRWPGAYGL